MTGRRAPLCSFAACKHHTKHPSGRCPYHRWGASAARLAGPGGLPSPTLTTELASSRPVTSTVEDYGYAKTTTYRDQSRKIHREDGPAIVSLWEDGSLRMTSYVQDDVPFREGGGPTIVEFFEDGRVSVESWSIEGGGYSRLDGPARITYDQDTGGVVTATYFLDGNRCRDRAAHTRLITRMDRDVLAREVSRSSYATLVDEGIPFDTVVDALHGGVVTPDGIREVANGSPVEWVAAYEEGSS